MSEETESTALDLFGAFLTAGDHKARMDTLLYGTENEAAGTRAAKRLGLIVEPRGYARRPVCHRICAVGLGYNICSAEEERLY